MSAEVKVFRTLFNHDGLCVFSDFAIPPDRTEKGWNTLTFELKDGGLVCVDRMELAFFP